jgi:hypothetical protein
MINETITSSPSAVTTPTGPVSDVIVDNKGAGSVYLEARASGGDWVVVTDTEGAFTVDTPDDTIEYRFRPSALSVSAVVYFGP